MRRPSAGWSATRREGSHPCGNCSPQAQVGQRPVIHAESASTSLRGGPPFRWLSSNSEVSDSPFNPNRLPEQIREFVNLIWLTDIEPGRLRAKRSLRLFPAVCGCNYHRDVRLKPSQFTQDLLP